jgi:hypothetical protein
VPKGAAAATRPPVVNVNVQNTAPGVQVAAGRGRVAADGSMLVDVMVSQSLDRMHAGGQLDRAMRPRTGVRRS